MTFTPEHKSRPDSLGRHSKCLGEKSHYCDKPTYLVPSGLFKELEKIILNFTGKSKFGKISKELLRKKNGGGFP